MKNKNAEKIVIKLLGEFERIRKEKELSHDKLASIAGLNRSTISLLESKKRVPTILTCLKIADALEVSLADLIKSVS
jgi:DNA-binding XRE family transcriptional regulator